MDKDKETEEQKLRDLTPEKDAKGGATRPVITYPPTQQPPIDPPISDTPPGTRPRVSSN
jgi:hypothetical protein